MLQIRKTIWIAALLLATTHLAPAFVLLGPSGAQGNVAKDWQLPGQNDGWEIGYTTDSIGAPVYPWEAYRYNVPVLYYAFDQAFIEFFGTNGIKAVDAAMRILNELPAATHMSRDLSEFPLSTQGINYEASQLGLVDLKTTILSRMMERLGVDDSIRWLYGIRQRINLPDDFGDYTVIKYNYDPVTLMTSSYVNGTLWTYRIFESIPTQTSDAVELVPAGLEDQPINIPVGARSRTPFPGIFLTGLTRDDAGAIRYLFNPARVVPETLIPGILPSATGGWLPFIGTNFQATNAVLTNFPTIGLRGGINKIRFQKVFFDSIIGSGFTAFTNRYKDFVIATNAQVVSQWVLRPVIQPDIIFTAADLGPGIITDRTTAAGWINDDLIAGSSTLGGPGVITGPVTITFNELFPYLNNITPSFITEPFRNDPNARGLIGPTWATFDGTTNAPIIYPQLRGFNLYYLRSVAEGNQ
jgi:hypothetical protein